MDVPDLHFLQGSQAQALLSTHPNSCELGVIPDVYWPLLVQFYISGRSDQPIPQNFAEIISQIILHQLPRTPMLIPNLLKLPSEVGMSPKKSHEVARMATYIVRLIHANNLLEDQLRIVDVGAGQGYLTRSLRYHLPGVHILALDGDAEQTKGAQRWERHILSDSHPPIAHKTVLLTPRSLLSVIDDWILETRSEKQSDSKRPIPVLFVALHACGSLTLDILRAYIKSLEGAVWSGAGVVAVGCCYNLMYPGDFPLSHAYRSSGDQPFQLPNSAFHLAAQVPSQWLQSVSPPKPTPSASLAVKKIHFRAILTPLLENATPAEPSADMGIDHQSKPTSGPVSWTHRQEARFLANETSAAAMPAPVCLGEPALPATGTGLTPHSVRLGKLRDRFYKSWTSYLRAVEEKLAIRFTEDVFNEDTKGLFADETANAIFERKVQALHTMRCLLGPVVESTILKDRVRWVKDALEWRGLQVQLVNLFDQSTGSGRNMAIVIAPQLPLFDEDKKL